MKSQENELFHKAEIIIGSLIHIYLQKNFFSITLNLIRSFHRV